jgi:hypothetical protein
LTRFTFFEFNGNYTRDHDASFAGEQLPIDHLKENTGICWLWTISFYCASP